MSRCTPSRETSGPWPTFNGRRSCRFSIEEDDAGVFHSVDGDARDLLHVDQALLFFLIRYSKAFVNFIFRFFGALAEDVGHMFLGD